MRATVTCFLLYDDQHTHARGAGAEAAISLIAQPPLVLEDRRAEDARCKAGSAGILSFMKGSKPDEPGPASEDRRLREGRRGQVSRTRYLPTPSIAPSGGPPWACEAGGISPLTKLPSRVLMLHAAAARGSWQPRRESQQKPASPRRSGLPAAAANARQSPRRLICQPGHAGENRSRRS